jgi:hypothetical protein
MLPNIRFELGQPYFVATTGVKYLLGYYATASAAYDPPSLNAGTQTTTTVNVTGAAMGAPVLTSFSLSLQGLQLSGDVSSAGVVTVVLRNGTAGTVNLSPGTLRVAVGKFMP